MPTGSTLSNSAPLRDRRSPQQAYKNAAQDAQLIGEFLDFFTNTVGPKIAEGIDNAAKVEAGKVLDAFPGIDTTGTGTAEEVDAYNALSPRAKDFVIQAKSATAAQLYPRVLEAELVRPGREAITNPTASPEARATAFADAQKSARTAAGFDALPAYQITQQAQALATADGMVRGEAYKQRISKEADLTQVNLMQATGADLVQNFKSLSAQAATDVFGDQPLTTGLRAVLEQKVVDLSQNLDPRRVAMSLAGGIQMSLEQLTTPGEKLEFLERIQEATQFDLVAADGKTDLFSLPLNASGVTIRSRIEELLPGAEKNEAKETLSIAQQKIYTLMQEGKTAEAEQVRNALLMDPKNASFFTEAFNSTRALMNLESPEAEARGEEYLIEQIQGDKTATQLYIEMVNEPDGSVSASAIETMRQMAVQEQKTGKAGMNPLSPAFESFQDARRVNEDIIETGLAEYLEYSRVDLDSEPELKAATAEFRLKVRQEYIKRYQANDDNTFDPVIALKESAEIVAATRKEEVEALGEVGYNTPKGQYIAWQKPAYQDLEKIARANGGKIDSNKIPSSAIAKGTLRAWQAKNPGKSFDDLRGKEKENLLAVSITTFQREDSRGRLINYTPQEARKIVRDMLKTAEQQAAKQPFSSRSRVPETVPETEAEVNTFRKQAGSRASTSNSRSNASVEKTMELLQDAAQWLTAPQEDPYNFNKIFNNGGMGPQSMSFVNGFLGIVTGASPATAGQMTYATPESLTALRQAWPTGSNGLETPPMPQVAANVPVRLIPTAITSDQHELFVMVGVAEGTRTASGGYTKAYYGHTDPGDGNFNRGTVSGGRGSSASPEMVDRMWMGKLTGVQQKMRPVLMAYGLQPGTQGYNRVMFNLIDLTVQSPLAARDFAGKMLEMRSAGWTIESIAKARSQSFISPTTGRLDAPGFGNNYQRLMRDQRSRAGVYDYRRRV